MDVKQNKIRAVKMHLTFLSLAPSIILMAMFLLEPFLYQSGLERALVSELGQLIRLICAAIILVMMAYFGRYVFISGDSRLDSNKVLWISILVLGNVFGVPLFWYLFIHHPKPELAK